MAFIYQNNSRPQRTWTVDETKIPAQRAWAVKETENPHRPNSTGLTPRRVFQGSLIVNPSFQKSNEIVEHVQEEDMALQLPEVPQLPHTPRSFAIKTEGKDTGRECNVTVVENENTIKKTASLSRPLTALMGIVSLASFLALLFTVLILSGYVGARNCSCSVNQGRSAQKHLCPVCTSAVNPLRPELRFPNHFSLKLPLFLFLNYRQT